MDDLNVQSEKINFVPCIKWIQRGVAKTIPEKVQLTKEELRQIILETEEKLNIDTNENQGASTSINPEDEFDFEKYDEDGDNTNLGIHSLATISPDEEDGNSDSDSEKEDDLIKSDDNLIIVGHVEGDASILEIYVFNPTEESLYVHHDLILPSFPLCLEWLDYEPGCEDKGNYCAIGSMTPVIDVWDIDIVNCLEPAFTLGRVGSRRKGITRIGHTDAVLDLSWNKNFHHILASGSVDQSIILWDLDEGKPNTTLNAFNEKVQCLSWHKFESQTLLAGSCDKTAKIFDCRSDSSYKTWDLEGEAERIVWDPHEPFCFIAGTSTGFVQCFDSRQGMLWSFPAHEEELTGLITSSQCKGLLVTSSSDGTLKTWDYSYNTNQPPVLVHRKEMKMERIHCLEFCPDLPFVLASGGDNKNNNFTVLDLRSIDTVNHIFGSRSLVQLENTNEDSNEIVMEN